METKSSFRLMVLVVLIFAAVMIAALLLQAKKVEFEKLQDVMENT